jgi:hypothetical protein
MSDVPADYRDRLDLREQIERIDRQRAEGHKFMAEQHKLAAEQQKLVAEELKLTAEALKLSRDRWLAPWLLLASITSGAVVAVIGHFWR